MDYSPNSPAVYEQQEIIEHKLAGTFGALLFALAGGIVYFLLYQLGYLASLSGLIAIVCALKGYKLFAKKESTYGIVISVVMSILVIVLAWYACLSKDVYDAYIEWESNGVIDYTLTYWESVQVAYLYLEGEVAGSYFGDLAISLLLCIVGCFTTVRAAAKRTKAAKAQDDPDGYPVQAPSQAVVNPAPESEVNPESTADTTQQ